MSAEDSFVVIQTDVSSNPNIVLGDSESFKDGIGSWLTKGLFVENYTASQWKELKCRPYFTLKDKDAVNERGYKFLSLRKIYMEMADQSEYNFAMTVFGSFELWNTIAKSTWMKKHVEVWREDLQAKLKSEAFAVVKDIAVNGPPATALSAAKFLLTQEWKEEGVVRRKLTREEVKEKQNQLTKEDDYSKLLSEIRRKPSDKFVN